MGSRIAIFGDGTLSKSHKIRDGRITSRINQLRTRRDWVYLSKRGEAESDLVDQLKDPFWREEVDAVMLEARWSIYPPPQDAPDKWPKDSFYQQAVFLRDWADGKFGDEIPLIIMDPDLNSRRAFGVGGYKSLYVGAAAWKKMTPWMPETLKEVWKRAIFAHAYEPTAYEIETKRKEEHTYTTERIDWFTYDIKDETVPLPLSEREWDFLYHGADYYRRDAFWKFYTEMASMGARVATIGEWNRNRKNGGGGRFEGKGFRDLCEQAGVHFPTDGKGVPINEMQKFLAHSKFHVNIVTPVYARIGHLTNRMQEAITVGTVPFVDSSIQHLDHAVPKSFFYVKDANDLADKTRQLFDPQIYSAAIQLWRDHYRTNFNPEKLCATVERIIGY